MRINHIDLGPCSASPGRNRTSLSLAPHRDPHPRVANGLHTDFSDVLKVLSSQTRGQGHAGSVLLEHLCCFHHHVFHDGFGRKNVLDHSRHLSAEPGMYGISTHRRGHILLLSLRLAQIKRTPGKRSTLTSPVHSSKVDDRNRMST